MASQPILRMDAVMTPLPMSIAIDARIIEAREVMAENDIRHLPVTDGGELVGVITQRDIALILDPELDVPFHEELRVRTLCVRGAYVVEPQTPLATVLGEMARRRIGSALVALHGQLLGIFTVTDACRLFAEQLEAADAAT